MATTVPTTTFRPTVHDALPARLADALDALAAPLMTEDRECARLLCEARERLRALAATRYNTRISRESARRAQVRRIGSRLGWRTRLDG